MTNIYDYWQNIEDFPKARRRLLIKVTYKRSLNSRAVHDNFFVTSHRNSRLEKHPLHIELSTGVLGLARPIRFKKKTDGLHRQCKLSNI